MVLVINNILKKAKNSYQITNLEPFLRFWPSKYECYLEGLTMYKNSSNKESIIQNYNTRYNEAIKSNEDFQQNQLPWIFTFLVIFIAVLIPIVMKKRQY